MTEVAFDEQGHLAITPQQLLEAAQVQRRRLVNDVLCHGTPAIFEHYLEYRDFVHEVAEALNLSPFSIWIRGSAHIGFSITPRAGKVWVEIGDDSDIDLAVVDPDHYHLLDVEIRRWERTDSTGERVRVQRLRDGRRFYCYQHRDLPSTPTCDDYKSKIATISSSNDRTVTAFFFRDSWALHERYVKDVRDLVFENQLGLPAAGEVPRPRRWLVDGDLADVSKEQPELNLARKRSHRRTGVTDAGLQRLGGLGSVQRVWLDACDVSDDGISSLGTSENLRFLSLVDTRITEACLDTIARRFPNLQVLLLDDTAVTQARAEAFCGKTLVARLSGRNCGWSIGRGDVVRNSAGARVRVVT